MTRLRNNYFAKYSIRKKQSAMKVVRYYNKLIRETILDGHSFFIPRSTRVYISTTNDHKGRISKKTGASTLRHRYLQIHFENKNYKDYDLVPTTTYKRLVREKLESGSEYLVI